MNDGGELGNSTNMSWQYANPTPTKITTTIGSIPISSIHISGTNEGGYTRDSTFCISKTDGIVYGFGSSYNGQLGFLNAQNPTPAPITFNFRIRKKIMFFVFKHDLTNLHVLNKDDFLSQTNRFLNSNSSINSFGLIEYIINTFVMV